MTLSKMFELKECVSAIRNILKLPNVRDDTWNQALKMYMEKLQKIWESREQP